MLAMDRKKIIVDLDGTLALGIHREHLVREPPRKWDEYYSLCHTDEPNHNVIEMVKWLALKYDIVIITGRIERTREVTEEWLEKHEVRCDLMLMRPTDCRIQDTELKLHMLEEAGIRKEDVLVVLEDRQRVVESWRKSGFTCLQVAEGNF